MANGERKVLFHNFYIILNIILTALSHSRYDGEIPNIPLRQRRRL